MGSEEHFSTFQTRTSSLFRRKLVNFLIFVKSLLSLSLKTLAWFAVKVIVILNNLIHLSTRITPFMLEKRNNFAFCEELENCFESLSKENYYVPNRFRGTLRQALDGASSRKKILLIYMHSTTSKDTELFCRNFLCTQNIVKFVNENFVFWAMSVSGREGNQLVNNFKVVQFPALVLCAKRSFIPIEYLDAQKIETFNDIAVLSRIYWNYNGDSVLDDLSIAVMQVSHWASASSGSNTHQFSNLIEDQDYQYKMSLRTDQIHAEEQKRCEEELARVVEHSKILEQQKLKKQQELQDAKLRYRNNLPKEPPIGPDVTSVVIQFLNNTRDRRRFSLYSKVQDLYEYVFAHESTPENFFIVSTFPRRIFCDTSLTLREAGLPCGMLTIEEVNDVLHENLKVIDIIGNSPS